MDAKELRIKFAEMTADEMREASRGRELEEWREVNRFCGKCGAEMGRSASGARYASDTSPDPHSDGPADIVPSVCIAPASWLDDVAPSEVLSCECRPAPREEGV